MFKPDKHETEEQTMSVETYQPSYSEAQQIAAAIEQYEAFCAAMTRAIRSRKVKIKAGTYIDDRPIIGAPIRGYAPLHSCGSPAAMCVEAGGLAGGATTLK